MEKKKGYSMFERDKLDPADSMRIERNIYFEEQTADLSGLTALPLEQLQALREEYAAAEQAAFEAADSGGDGTNRRERPLPLTKPLSM